MSYLYALGTSLVGLTLLSELPIVAPKSGFRRASKFIILGNGQKKEVGFPVATWHWDYVTKAQRDAIRTFVAETSAAVYLTTRIEDDSYQTFQGLMHWVEEEEKDAGRRFDLDLEFTHLVPVE